MEPLTQDMTGRATEVKAAGGLQFYQWVIEGPDNPPPNSLPGNMPGFISVNVAAWSLEAARAALHKCLLAPPDTIESLASIVPKLHQSGAALSQLDRIFEVGET